MLHGHQVKVEHLSGWPDLPICQDNVNIVIIKVLLDILNKFINRLEVLANMTTTPPVKTALVK